MNLAEIYQALLNGETLVYETTGDKIKLSEDKITLVGLYYGDWRPTLCVFEKPEMYLIYKEPQWYEGDLSEGVLCRVKNYITDDWEIDMIKRFSLTSNVYLSYSADYPFKGSSRDWRIAEPLDLTKPLLPQINDE